MITLILEGSRKPLNITGVDAINSKEREVHRRAVIEKHTGSDLSGIAYGKPAKGGITIAPLRDYFVDRDVWGITHIVLVDRK